MNHVFCINSFTEGHMGCFQLLSIKNKGAFFIEEYASLWHVGEYFGYMPRSSILGSSGRSIYYFLRIHKIDFQSSFTILQFHHICKSVPFFRHPCHHVFKLSIIISVRWNISVIFTWISLMTKNFEHFLSASQPFEILLK